MVDNLITDVVDNPDEEIEIEIISNEPFSKEEDEMILKNVLKYGTKWECIAKLIRHRTPTMIKNRFNTHIKKNINIIKRFFLNLTGTNLSIFSRLWIFFLSI